MTSIHKFSKYAGVLKTPGGKRLPRETSVAQHVPYAVPLDANTLLTKDGKMLRTIKLMGYKFGTAEVEAIEIAKDVINDLLKGRATSQFALWTHLVRRKENRFPEGEYSPGFADDLNQAWRKKFESKQMFTNELYLTIVKKPPEGGINSIVRLWEFFGEKADLDEQRRARDKAHRQLKDVTRQFMVSLREYGTRLLGDIVIDGETYSEQLSLFSYLLNHEVANIKRPRQALSTYLPASRISFGNRTRAIQIHAKTRDFYAGVVSVKEYPSSTYSGMLNSLLQVPFEAVVTQSFSFMERSRVLNLMKKQKRQLVQAEDEAVSWVDEMTDAMDDVATGEVSYGVHHCSALVFGDSIDEVADNVAEIADSFAGGVTVWEDVNMEPAFWAQFPGNGPYVARRAPVSSRNFAGLAAFHNYSAGRIAGNHWGPSCTVLETQGGTPYYFNFHVADVGHTCVFGETGTGKTTFINFAIAQSLKYGGRRIYFDNGKNAKSFIEACGGRYSIIEPGEPTGFNPLQLPDSHRNRNFLYEWLKLLASKSGKRDLSDHDEDILAKTVGRSYEKLSPEDRTLQNIMPMLGNPTPGSIRFALEKWANGPYAWVFGSKTDNVNMKVPIVGYDMGQVLDAPDVRTPIMKYLFHHLEDAVDGTRIMIVLEEWWSLMQDPDFGPEAGNKVRLIRKKNGTMIFASQHADEIMDHPVGRLVVDQSDTHIFFPNSKARKEIYVDQLKVSEQILRIIRTLSKESRTFVINRKDESVVAKLDLNGMDEQIAVLSYREEVN